MTAYHGSLSGGGSSPAPGPGLRSARGRWLDLLLVGALLVAGFALRLHIAQHWVPEPAFAVGVDGDDWAGVFQGAARGLPFLWEQEWGYKYPLLPLMALAGARATGAPFACAALWASLVVGAWVAPLTYLLGRRLVGRPAALAGGVWMVVQDGLASFAALTTAYSLVPPAYLLLLLGLVATLDRRPRGWGATLAGSALLTAAMLHGALLAASALAAALAAWGVANLRRPRHWGALSGVVWPCLVGVALGLGLLLLQSTQAETPWGDAVRHVYEEVRQTVYHDPRYGVPTGHHVQRLVAGWSRWRHLRVSLWEQHNLPLLVLGPLVASGMVALVLAARRGQRGGRALLLIMLVGPVYGLVANSEDFHVFQWFPTLALVVAAGLGSWSLLSPRRAVVVACWAGAALLAAWQVWAPQRDELLQPIQRYLRVEAYVREARTTRGACIAAAAPVSARGTLLVGHPYYWGYRAFLEDAANLVELRQVDPKPLPPDLPEPIYLLAPEAPAVGTPPTQLPGCWLPVLELRGFADATLFRLGTCAERRSARSLPVLTPSAGGSLPPPAPGAGAPQGAGAPPDPGARPTGGRVGPG